MVTKILLYASAVIFLAATGFVIYTHNNPQASFPWSNTVTFSVYAVYIIVMIVCYVLYKRRK